MDDLARIYIRAQVTGTWDAYSLCELMQTEEGQKAILNWYRKRLDPALLVGYVGNLPLTEERVKCMVVVLEDVLGQTIYRVKGDD